MNWTEYSEKVLKLKSPERIKFEAIREKKPTGAYFEELEKHLHDKRKYYLDFIRLAYIGYVALGNDNELYFVEPIEDTLAKIKKIPKVTDEDINEHRTHPRLLSAEDAKKAMSAVARHETKDRREDINRILYAMLITQDSFGVIDELTPNALSILASLKDLSFTNFNNNNAATRQKDARSIIEKVLPYSIACGKKEAKSIEEKVEARLVGHEILIGLNNIYFSGTTTDPSRLFTIEQPVDTQVSSAIVDLFSEKGGSALLNIMNAIRGETFSIINDDAIGQTEENSLIYQVSLIYACSNLGEENVEELFTMSEEALEERVTTLKEKNKPKTRAKQRRSLWIR